MGILDNTAIERIAAPDLTSDALALLKEFGGNDDVVFFLGRLVWQGEMTDCVPALFDIAVDPARGRYARIAAIRGAMSVGGDGVRERLLEALADHPAPLDRRLLAEALDWAAPTSKSIGRLLRAVDSLMPHERFETTGLGGALHEFIDRLPLMFGSADQPLGRLAEGLNTLLDRQPYVERGECHVSEAFAWLMPPALHAVDRLVAARAPQALESAAMAILLKNPTLRFWRGSEMGEYRSSLSTNIPRWQELNDQLYWQSVRDRRVHLAKKGERLVDDWQASFLDHFWKFNGEDFDRCLVWVRTEPELDDRLVALSRCLQLFVQADRPEAWRERLREVVAGEPELEARLEAALNPRPSPAIEEMEAEHRDWEREHEARERQEEKERADWVRRMKADPGRVRHPEGLKPGEFSNDQFHLLMSLRSDGGIVTSREEMADWKFLVADFGEDVAQAFRDAAIAHWRAYRPGLRSEGAAANSTPYSLLFGMVGLAIEAKDVLDFPANLTSDEAQHAFRYFTWELNGFPGWLESLFRAFPEQGLAAVKTELVWELENSVADEPMHYVLHDILYHAPWLHADVAPVLLDWLMHHATPNPDSVRYSTNILASGGTAPEALAALARAKAQAGGDDPQRPRWFALWVDSDPGQAIPTLAAEMEALSPEAASAFASLFIVSLLGDRHGAGSSVGAFRTAAHLKALYVLMHRYIRVGEDINRIGKGVYSPTLRDNAQEARNSLFNILADIPGAEAYAAIKALEEDHPESSYRRWMGLRARERAIADADEPLWTPDQVHRFAADI